MLAIWELFWGWWQLYFGYVKYQDRIRELSETIDLFGGFAKMLF
jgi:hypothetical protein